MTIAAGELVDSAPPPSRRPRRRRTAMVATVAGALGVALMLPIGMQGVPPTYGEEPLGVLSWTAVAEGARVCINVTSQGPLTHVDSATPIARGMYHYRVEDIRSHWYLRWTATAWENGQCTATPVPVEGLGLTGVWSSLDGTPLAVVGLEDPAFLVDDEPPDISFEKPSAQGGSGSGIALPDISGWVRRPDTCYLVTVTASVLHPSTSSDNATSEPERVCLDTAW